MYSYILLSTYCSFSFLNTFFSSNLDVLLKLISEFMRPLGNETQEMDWEFILTGEIVFLKEKSVFILLIF